ncbi:MAG TPA: MscL family protein [Candidatus Saccharimonadales bacterium]|jgi:large-conductance mechanosensitive channel
MPKQKDQSNLKQPKPAAVDPKTLRVETKSKVAKSKARRKSSVDVLLETDDVVKAQFSGFVNFIREHAIVGVAVGFVVGQQAQGIIKQLTTSFIDPAFKLFFGQSLSGLSFTLHLGANNAKFMWGALVYVLLNLLFVLATIYALIKIFQLDKLDKKKED